MYSQSTVIAGGLAHIPVAIGVFYFILKIFSKRASNFPQDTEPKKSQVKSVEQKSASKPEIFLVLYLEGNLRLFY